MDVLGRYYTADVVSSLLVNSMETKTAESIVDLGIGDAALTIAAKKRWTQAIFYATEIEKKKIRAIEKELAFVNISYYDSLKSNVKTRLKIKFGTVDVAICNPPYIKVEKKRSYKKLFAEAGIEECLGLNKLTSEIVFFAHNLALLKAGGELGIIVSDSLVTGKEFRIFRETILTKCDIRTIIQLPDKIFPKTEARTHILILGKSQSKNDTCNLLLVDSNGNYEHKLIVNKEQLVERMDFQFWKYNINVPREEKTTLNDIGAIITRGSLSYKELRQGKMPFFHTTNFKKEKLCFGFVKSMCPIYDKHLAKSGDIVIARVGKRNIGKMAKITKGKILISDCIFSITVPVKFRKQVWKQLNSDAGRAWLTAYAHGVCSQVISKSDLQKFPVFSNNCFKSNSDLE